MVTVLSASAVPVKMGVVMLVTLSIVEAPVSLASARSGVDGAAGAEASIVTVRAEEASETLPAASVAVAVMLWVPAERVLAVIE